MKQRFLKPLLAAMIVLLYGTLVIKIVAMLLISRADHNLYVRLIGPTMAIPNWQPWWGYYALWGGSFGTAMCLAVFTGWLWWKKRWE